MACHFPGETASVQSGFCSIPKCHAVIGHDESYGSGKGGDEQTDSLQKLHEFSFLIRTALRNSLLLQVRSDHIRQITACDLCLFYGVFVVSHFDQNVMVRYVLIEFVGLLYELSRKSRI